MGERAARQFQANPRFPCIALKPAKSPHDQQNWDRNAQQPKESGSSHDYASCEASITPAALPSSGQLYRSGPDANDVAPFVCHVQQPGSATARPPQVTSVRSRRASDLRKARAMTGFLETLQTRPHASTPARGLRVKRDPAPSHPCGKLQLASCCASPMSLLRCREKGGLRGVNWQENTQAMLQFQHDDEPPTGPRDGGTFAHRSHKPRPPSCGSRVRRQPAIGPGVAEQVGSSNRLVVAPLAPSQRKQGSLLPCASR